MNIIKLYNFYFNYNKIFKNQIQAIFILKYNTNYLILQIIQVVMNKYQIWEVLLQIMPTIKETLKMYLIYLVHNKSLLLVL